LKDYGDKLSAEKKEAIQKELNSLKEAHKEKNISAIDASMATLNTAWQAASEEMYKATQNAAQPDGQGQPAGDAGQQKTDSEVTDVDFEEVKEDKK
jgi:molecular chaperone DnaK